MEVAGRLFANPLRWFFSTLERSLLVWERPLAAVMLSTMIFIGLSATAGLPWRLSTAPYYNLLADAFLHGQLSLRILPEKLIDLSLYQGRYYLYWGPLPAVLALPLVAVFGAGFSDVLQTLVYSGLTVGMLAAVLRAANERGIIHLDGLRRAILVLFFALGTAFTPITGSGHVWQMAQVQSLLFAFLAYFVAFHYENGKAFFLTGCAMAGVFLTRPSAIFIGVFLVWYLLNRHWHTGARRLLRNSAVGLTPVIIAVGLFVLYNLSRFGSMLETGITYHLMHPYFAGDFQTYGLFNMHFIPANFYYTYIFYPYSFHPPGVNVRCGSLFLLSPLFFAAFLGLWKHYKQIDTWMLLLSVLLGNLPVLMLMGPGSSLFGPRYTLDFVMPLLLLTSLGMERLHQGVVSLLMVISVLQYLLGTLIYLQGVP